MKKSTLLVAALSFLLVVGCETKKQPGEEYYDPNYKPAARVPAAQTEASETDIAASSAANQGTPALEAPTNGPQPAATETDVAAAEAKAEKDNAKVVKTEPAAVAKPAEQKPAVASADVEKGKNLIAKSDCLACHKVDAKVLGPAYVDVAKKYEPNAKNIDYLANKIIKGGAGVWGDIPMSPHPTLSQGDAKEMVKYILSLK